jgi:hypothetical protein
MMGRALRARSSRSWGFWRHMTLRRGDGVAYLDRLRFIQTPWFGVYLHRIDAPDPGVDLHDHPWPFVSIVLRGGYDEYRSETRDASRFAQLNADFPSTRISGDVVRRAAGSVRRMRLDECHTIFRLHRTPTWTLVIVGHRVRDWGFYVPRSVSPYGFVLNKPYDTLGRRSMTQEDR